MMYKLPLGNNKDWEIPAMDVIPYDPNKKNTKEFVKMFIRIIQDKWLIAFVGKVCQRFCLKNIVKSQMM